MLAIRIRVLVVNTIAGSFYLTDVLVLNKSVFK